MLQDMRFADLPADWAQRPITDPEVFEGVVDLIVAEQTRAEGATYVLFCHEGGRLMQPLCVPDEPQAVDKGAVITDVRVEEKLGGTSGTWRRE